MVGGTFMLVFRLRPPLPHAPEVTHITHATSQVKPNQPQTNKNLCQVSAFTHASPRPLDNYDIPSTIGLCRGMVQAARCGQAWELGGIHGAGMTQGR